MKKQFVSVAFGLSIIAFGVQAQNHHQMDHKDHAEMTMSYDAPKEFQQQLAGVYQANLDLKEAFVASETSQVKEAVSSVQNALSEVDMSLLQEKAHMAWMDQLKTLNSSLTAISGAGTIDTQRQSFAEFSQALYQSVKSFGIGGEEAFYQYCPMANNNQGAYWLSDSKEIRNPYFGDKMLSCGSVKEEIN
uniref:DUF3347 domain-containing protein n=1 Tax=Roseihalotalea indica TaxID=2867963 RepID=A0AA49JHP2_9BACT|nr:DUF3347 domain-containing protein [Tunicatimonas sp. TK19036]